MKRKLKIITLILTILLIGLISFGGIYVAKNNTVTNIIPEFLTDMNINGSREISFVVDTSTKQIIYDSEGNIVDSSTETEETTTTTVDEPVNKAEDLTLENYKISKNIIEKRLNLIGVGQYEIRLDEETGKIILKIPENSRTENIIQSINGVGDFKMVDAETDEVLLDNSHLKSAKAMYGGTDTGTVVYVDFAFNEEGKAKLEEVTRTYISTQDEEGNTVDKKVSMKIDDNELISSTFEDPITNGQLSLTLGSTITTEEELDNYLKQAIAISSLVDSGKMPVIYTIEDVKYVGSILQFEQNQVFILGVIILTIMFIYIVIKYKELGILSTISNIGFIAILLLIIRYTNVMVSLEGASACVLSIILNYIFTILVMKKQQNVSSQMAFKEAIISFLFVSIPLWILAIVFTLINITVTQSAGMILFWGLLLIFAHNYIFTKPLLKDVTIKETDKKFKKLKNRKKVVFIIVPILIIIAGVVVTFTLKTNKAIEYKEAYNIEFNLEKEYNTEDIRNITNEVFPNQQVMIQKVEYFNDMVLVTVDNITDEQKAQLIEKINAKYELSYNPDSITATKIPALKIRDLVKPYVQPFVIASLVILAYMMIRFYKLKVLKVMLVTILTLILPVATYFSLIVITRLPISILSIPVGIFIYAISIFILAQKYNEKKIKQQKTENKDR